MLPKQTVSIALGSNIAPEKHLHAASALLRTRFPSIRFSSVYRTAAREVEDQADFLNAVAVVETEQSPEDVLAILQAIERSLGKAPPYRFGPRTIDLDLLLYGDEIRNSGHLILPHPRMHERRFVLEPLCEMIDPHAAHPMLKKSWGELLEKVGDQGCIKTNILL